METSVSIVGNTVCTVGPKTNPTARSLVPDFVSRNKRQPTERYSVLYDYSISEIWKYA